jgi:hypothetical protein
MTSPFAGQRSACPAEEIATTIGTFVEEVDSVLPADPEAPSRTRRDRTAAPLWYKARVAMFHVVLRRSGPAYDHARPLEEQTDWAAHAAFMEQLVDDGFIVLGGPLSDEQRVVHAVEAESDDAIRARLARDPWFDSHLRIDAIEPWTIRLDARRR